MHQSWLGPKIHKAYLPKTEHTKCVFKCSRVLHGSKSYLVQVSSSFKSGSSGLRLRVAFQMTLLSRLHFTLKFQFLIKQFSPLPCHFLPLRSKYFSSASCSQTPSIYVHPSMWETNIQLRADLPSGLSPSFPYNHKRR